MTILRAITIVFAISNQRSSVEQIYKNINIYDKQNVILTGKVVGLTFSISDVGINFTYLRSLCLCILNNKLKFCVLLFWLLNLPINLHQ